MKITKHEIYTHKYLSPNMKHVVEDAEDAMQKIYYYMRKYQFYDKFVLYKEETPIAVKCANPKRTGRNGKKI